MLLTFFKTKEFVSFAPLLIYLSLWGKGYRRDLSFSLYEIEDGLALISIYAVFLFILYKGKKVFQKIEEKVNSTHLPFFYSTINVVLIIINRQLFIHKRDYDEYHTLIKITLAICIGLLIWFWSQKEHESGSFNKD